MLLPTAAGEIAEACCRVEEVECSSLDTQEWSCP